MFYNSYKYFKASQGFTPSHQSANQDISGYQEEQIFPLNLQMFVEIVKIVSQCFYRNINFQNKLCVFD